MIELERISRGWKPTNELRFIEGRLTQRWIGDLIKYAAPWPSLCPQILFVTDDEWREVPGQ